MGRDTWPVRGARGRSGGQLGMALEQDEAQRAAQGLDVYPHWEFGLVPGKWSTTHMFLSRHLTSADTNCRKTVRLQM